VDESTRALLCDFGISDVMGELANLPADGMLTNVHWLSYELAQGNPWIVRRANEFSDIYAFGCVVLEVLSGEIPYHPLRDVDVREEKEHHRCPPRPTGIKDEHWAFMLECWNVGPETRPRAFRAVARLDEFISQIRPGRIQSAVNQ